MERSLIIYLPFGRKAHVAQSTYQAIGRAARIMRCDARVAAYAAGPHEGVTPEIVAAIRKRMIARGELPSGVYSRRGETT